MKMARNTPDDAGFSLTELLIVIGLLSVVLAGAYALLQVASDSANLSNRRSVASQEVGFPLDYLSKLLMQNLNIEAAAPNSITFLTDSDGNGVGERNIVTVAGSRLHLTRWRLNSAQVNTVKFFDKNLSDKNTNIARGRGLLRYYDRDRVQITNMGAVASDARSAVLTVSVTIDGEVTEESVSILFRNRDR